MLSARLEAISTVLIITKGKGVSPLRWWLRNMRCTLLLPQSVTSLRPDEVFNKNILYFWTASQRQILKPCFKDQNPTDALHKCHWFNKSWCQDGKLMTHTSVQHLLFTAHWDLLTTEMAFLTCASSIAIYKSAIHKAPLLPRLPISGVWDNGQWIFIIIHHPLHASLLIYSGINEVKITLEY